MKQPKKLTRNQKEILVKKGMNPDDYMLHSEDEKEMILYNRKEKRLEAVEKEAARCGPARWQVSRLARDS